jgi:FkbM family methyltransferase
MRFLLNRFQRYLAEIAFALRVGASLKDKFALVFWTLAFHAKLGKEQTLEASVRVGELTPHLRMRAGGGDLFVFYEMLMDDVYGVPPHLLTRKPEFILDLGANVGLAALAFAAHFPQAKIVCVEPHPETAALLRHNLACLGDRAGVVEAAVSGEPGTMRLNLAAGHYNASLVRRSDAGVEVRTTTVEQVMTETGMTRIDILKMDIEGAERLVLTPQPEWLKTVGFLTIELHDGYGFIELARDVATAGLIVEAVGGAQAIAHRKSGRLTER